MAFELDHLFIFTSVGAAAAQQLASLGLTEGTPNTHPGQGSACRRFFFRNVYLELLWLHDQREAQSEATRRTCFWERWSGRTTGACPFGLIFRPSGPEAETPPFASWEYRPTYLPEGMSFRVGNNASHLSEPFLCALPFRRRPDELPEARREPLEHAPGLREVTRVELSGPWTNFDLEGNAESAVEPTQSKPGRLPIRLQRSPEYQAQLGFDGETRGQQADLRPALPLILRW
jgi:hypothetical protein